jgi:NAD(P)-dependent dehydrogenase (short-subunit alcohol dehydrogenase family)
MPISVAHSKQTAIVTGGGRGIGLAIVNQLLDDGFNVCTCGRGERPDQLPDSAEWVVADVSKVGDVNILLEHAKTTFSPVHLLVNNAGVQVEKTLAESTDDDWDLVMGVNCRGVFNMSRACLPDMQENGGNIINIGSISGKVSDPSMALYNASKAFVHGLTRSIAVDHGPMVRCNAIQPGWIMTAMADDAFAMAVSPELSKQDALARHPVGRFGKPEDIATMVSFLASVKSRYLSGECITVDGGLTAASPLRPGLF